MLEDIKKLLSQHLERLLVALSLVRKPPPGYVRGEFSCRVTEVCAGGLRRGAVRMSIGSRVVTLDPVLDAFPVARAMTETLGDGSERTVECRDGTVSVAVLKDGKYMLAIGGGHAGASRIAVSFSAREYYGLSRLLEYQAMQSAWVTEGKE